MGHRRSYLLALASLALYAIAACGNRNLGGLSQDSDAQKSISTNYAALHDSSSSQYRDDCLSCHSDILEETSLNPNIEPAHQAMLSATPGETTQAKCVYCHASTDLSQHSAGNLRKNVSAATCDLCHGPAGPGPQYFQQ